MGFQSGSWLDEQVRRAMLDKRGKSDVIKLPCCGTMVEVSGKQDLYLECPACHKHVAITWQRGATFNAKIGDQHAPSLNCTCDSCLRHFHR